MTLRDKRSRNDCEDDDLNRWFLDGLDIIASLGGELVVSAHTEPGDVFAATRAAILALLPVRETAFLTVNDEHDFELGFCEPPEFGEVAVSEVARAVDDGIFGRAIATGQAVIVAPGHPGLGDSAERFGLFHVISTRSKVSGMLYATLESTGPMIPDVEHKILSIILFHCGSALETALLYRELDSYNRSLENRVRERTAELERSRQDARAAAEAKSDFLAVMSHELRTPINGVLGMADFLLDSCLDEEQRDHAEAIRDATGGLLSMVNHILDFSKIEAGEVLIGFEPFDPWSTISSVHRLCEPAAAEKGLSISITREPDLLPELVGDPQRIGQIVHNLVNNAIKFTERGGIEIRITCSDTGTSHVELAVEVADTGVGIHPNAQARIFDRFTQAEPSSTRSHGGAGLGLAVSHELAELMGGSLRVVSQPGLGSTFTLSLPLSCTSVPKPVTLPAATPTHESEGPIRVLVVEDNIVNQKVAARILQKIGCEVDVATDGLEALDCWSSAAYDLIFMDCHMPNMNGYEAAASIRRQENEAEQTRIPIVAVTANAMKGDRETCLAAGMDDYICKPIKQGDLRRMIEQWCPGALPGDV